ncbi:MAG: hypothetical protein K8R48_07480 [Alphaproteobacteria bacterium]|nr:hypothetical protein [Alphaproteobacteria bacterium]
MAFKPFSTYGQKDSFGQKTGRFLRKTFLRLAFVGAVGGPIYHHYGTKENIEAKITSVETLPSDKKDAPVETIIHTDKGTFVNETTRWHSKDGEDVAALTKILQPGATVKITVYGIDPKIGGKTLDDFGVYRNITEAAPVTVVPPVSKPVMVVVTAPVKPAATVVTPVLVAEDSTLAETSIANADLEAIEQKMPQLYRDLTLMKQLPLTGRSIYNIVTNPAYGIKACVTTQIDAGEAGDYSDKLVRVQTGESTTTSFHEYFHAAQDVNDADDKTFSLTMTDAAFCELLEEASAVAYEITTRKEAENRSLAFFDPPVVVKKIPGGTQKSWKMSASDDEKTKAVFNAAYDKAWQDGASLGATARETKSLAAGGKAVVSYLMDGNDTAWMTVYAELANNNVNNNAQMFALDGRENKTGYKDARNAVFLNQGLVSPSLSLIPDEYLGADADACIKKSLDKAGIQSTSTTAPVKTAQKQKPLSPG